MTNDPFMAIGIHSVFVVCLPGGRQGIWYPFDESSGFLASKLLPQFLVDL
jgi:hypothetical protein